MGLLSSPFSRLLGLVAILALYISFTGSYLGSAALSGTAARALYLLALCLFIGVGNWTTFIFGIVAFKNLPRLTFGNLQAKLFPIYFKVLTASLSVVLVVYAAKHAADGRRATASAARYQLAALGGAVVFTLANLLALEPMTTAVMRERHKAERGERPDEVKRLSKRFGMLHGLSSLANLLALGLGHCHLWHIASRLQV